MTTISASSSAHSPKQHLVDMIASQVSTGQISSTDQTALDSAVDDIDSSLSSGGSSSGTRLDPSDMKSRIDDLIAGEVSKGTLTSDQADTLKQVFSQDGHGGPHGPGGAGGPPPGPPPSAGGASDLSSLVGTSSTDDDSNATSSNGSGSNATDLLASFIEQLQASRGQSSGYAANGQTSTSNAANALLLNFEV